MSIISIEQRFGGHTGTDTSCVIEYIAHADSIMSSEEVLASPLIPEKGARFSPTSSLYVTQRTAEREEKEPLIWYLTISYGIQEGNISTGKETRLVSGPSFETIPYQVVAEKGRRFDDITGELSDEEEAITNSAGDAFAENPPMKEVRNLIISWTQKENYGFDPERAMNQIDTINENPIIILGINIDAKKAFMKDIKPTMQVDGSYVTEYSVEINKGKDFILSLQDRGYRALDDSGKLYNIRLSDINPSKYGPSGTNKEEDADVSDSVKLDGTGHILNDPDPKSTKYRNYLVHEYSDWNKTLDLLKRR